MKTGTIYTAELATPKSKMLKAEKNEIPIDAADTCSIALPKITSEIADDFYPWLIQDIPDGYDWNQAAVDFACLLKSECYKRRENR